MTDPNTLDRFGAYPNKVLDCVFIVDAGGSRLTGEVADRILGDREAAVIWDSDPLGRIVFPRSNAGWDMAQLFVAQLNDLDAEQAAALIDSAPGLTTAPMWGNGDTMTDPNLDRFTVRLDRPHNHVIIGDRGLTPLTGEVADRLLGDREAAVVWYSDQILGYIAFPTTDAGWAMATALADQLNSLDAEADAEQAAELIDSAAGLAEQIEADSAPGLTAAQRRGIAAYQRAAAMPLYPYGESCGEQWQVGDRVRIGDPGDPYYAGALAGVGLYHALLGQTATVILPQNPFCPLIVLLDDDSVVVGLPHASLYVRRAE